MLIYIYFFIPLRASKQLLSELINIHKLSFAIGRSASNVQPALININELDLGNSRTRNLVSSPSHSAAASGTEEEPSRRHTGARYRTLPPRTPPLPGFVTRQAFVGTRYKWMIHALWTSHRPKRGPTFTHSTRNHLLCIKW